jgi:PBP1b-binding outer membrane lipoprotein LpoB
MPKMKKLISILMIAAIFLAACSKEKLNEPPLNQTPDNFNEIRLVTLTNGSKSTGITLLEFTSVEHYENTIAALEALVEQHEDSFLFTWRSLNDDALNAKEDEVGFVDYQPLIDFDLN